MIRRTVLAIAAAAALILAPTVAMAHDAPRFTCKVSDSTPAIGQPVKVQCSGGRAHERVTLKIAGTKSLTRQLNAKGEGTFTVRLTAAGVYTLRITNAKGAVLFKTTLKVAVGYHAHGYTCTVSDSTPAIGQHFSVKCTGGQANESITQTITGSPQSISKHGVEIAGTTSSTSQLSANGEGSFTNTLGAAGVYTLAMTSASGAVGSTQIVTVVAASVGSSAAGGVPSSPGFDGAGLAVGGGALVLAGAGAVLVARRRKSA